jgi:hypothetical protein
MASKVKIAFESKCVAVSLDDILPTKKTSKQIKRSRKYLQIAASILEIGIIEPPVIAKVRNKREKFLLLDGHLRIEVLKDSGTKEITCLVATDDETYTYNKRINRLATIQEHKMILKAIESGVPQERIAKALDVNISTIRQKRALLEGICPEVVELFKNRHCPGNSFRTLKKMKPIRQIEVAELMIAMNNYSGNYSKAMLAATPRDQLAQPENPKKFKGLSSEQIAQMESEMAKLQQQMKFIGASYGPDHLNLVLARGYIATLLKNSKVSQYLEKNHSGILTELRRISKVVSMGQEELV